MVPYIFLVSLSLLSWSCAHPTPCPLHHPHGPDSRYHDIQTKRQVSSQHSNELSNHNDNRSRPSYYAEDSNSSSHKRYYDQPYEQEHRERIMTPIRPEHMNLFPYYPSVTYIVHHHHYYPSSNPTPQRKRNTHNPARLPMPIDKPNSLNMQTSTQTPKFSAFSEKKDGDYEHPLINSNHSIIGTEISPVSVFQSSTKRLLDAADKTDESHLLKPSLDITTINECFKMLSNILQSLTKNNNKSEESKNVKDFIFPNSTSNWIDPRR